MFQELTPSPSSGCAGGLVEKKNHEHTLMGTELATEMLENLHILTMLSAQENLIDFSYNAYVSHVCNTPYPFHH